LRAPGTLTTGVRVLMCFGLSLSATGCRDTDIDDSTKNNSATVTTDLSNVVYVDESGVLPMEPYLPGTRVACPNIASSNGDLGPAFHQDTLSIALADSIASIPEFHDCQRLIVHVAAVKGRAASLEYGPLVGVWASASLNDWEESDFDKQAIPTVELVNYNNVEYPDLGIGPGYNCLYLRSHGSAWVAGMKKQDRSNACPSITEPEFSALAPLTVIRTSPRPEHKDSIPPVARWDWDPVHERHYIGVKCARAWCEVGKAPVGNSSTYPPNSATQHIKGWYDEQRLALLPSGRLTPGNQARIIPEPGLDTLTADNFHCNAPCDRSKGWVAVASALYNNAADPDYAQKMNLRPGIRAQIALRSRDSLGTVLWQARIISQKDTVYKKVLRVDHHGFKIPGTARWFWRENDEVMWIKCLAGCCSVMSEDW
jgi:hypothetical protein